MNGKRRLRNLLGLACAAAVASLTTLGAAGPSAGALAAPRAAAAANGAVAWGDNSAGQLGNGTVTASGTPVGVGNLSGIKALAAGDRFTLALLTNGTVEAWGDNTHGQLGDGTTASSDVPVPVKGLTGVTAIAAGGAHALALLSNGTVVAWGDNIDGQLGNGTTTSSDVPAPVTGLTGVTAVSAGSLHSLALLSGGTVEAWGSNGDGQLGDGSLTNSSVPVAVHGLTGVSAVSAGGGFSTALLKGGTVKAWGNGTDGELGNGQDSGSAVPVAVTGLTGVTHISDGDTHTLALLSGGTVMAWGSDGFGQLGNPQANPAGGNSSDVPVPVQGLSGTATAVSAGGQSSLALLSGGTVAAWGDNALGQLGNGSTTDSTTPVTVTGLTGATAITGGSDYGAALVPTPGPAVTATPESIFRIVPTPSPGVTPLQNGVVDDSLVSVSAPAATNALAVGNEMRGITKTLFGEHWNGTKWATATIPSPAGRNPTIRSVVDLSPTDGWAVGFTTTSLNSTDRTLIEHWNGSTWSTVPSPNPIGGTAGNDQLEAVDGVSPTDVWAVGQDFSSNGGGIHLLFEHFNGTTWTVFSIPVSGGAQFAQAITTISANDAWVVGNNALATTLAAHWNGTTWTIVPTPSAQDGPSPINDLTGVSAVSSTDVYASGFEGNVNNQNFAKPYVLHWNGTAWSLVTLPNSGGEGSQLQSVAALSAGDVWAVGHTQESDGAILTLGEHFNGTAWSIAPTPDPGELGPLVDNSLLATASPGNGIVWALGGQETLGECCQQTLGLQTTHG
jgi:alpha-tubulin suppressor-like RCC1 family protein